MEPYREAMGSDTIVAHVAGLEPTAELVREPALGAVDEASRLWADETPGDGRAATWLFLLANEREAHEVVVGRDGVIASQDTQSTNASALMFAPLTLPPVGFENAAQAAGQDWSPEGNLTMTLLAPYQTTFLAYSDDDEVWFFDSNGVYLGQEPEIFPGRIEATGAYWQNNAATLAVAYEHEWDLKIDHPQMALHFELHPGFFGLATSGWQVAIKSPTGEERSYELDSLMGPTTVADLWEPAPQGTWHATGTWTVPGQAGEGLLWSVCTDGASGPVAFVACGSRP